MIEVFRKGLASGLLFLAIMPSARALEFEVDGQLTQTMVGRNGTNLHASASFTVYVRDGSWMMDMIETNELGGVGREQFGCTNGGAVYECRVPMTDPPDRATSDTNSRAFKVAMMTSAITFAQITPGDVPVAQTDSAIVGHLWMMFGSQAYWPTVSNQMVTPVYDWQASAAAGGQGNRVRANWDLMAGSGLPREVDFLGWGGTNALYQSTGALVVGGVEIPAGFIFEERQIVSQGFGPDDQVRTSVTVRKRVEVTVTAVRPFCSKALLIPLPTRGAMVIDYRLLGDERTGTQSSPPSYGTPAGQWIDMEEGRKQAITRQTRDTMVRERFANQFHVETNQADQTN